MSKIHRLILSAVAVLLINVIPAAAQDFKNLAVKQFGEKINIEYAISGEKLGQLFTVTPYYSVDAGKTFLPMKSVKGNVGANVPGGRNQIIIWDVLKDMKELTGDVIFKLTADTKTSVPTQDEIGKFNFKIESIHHLTGNKAELLLTITNNGPTRDLKMINGLITITDFKKQKYDAQRGTIAEVEGSERYSTPTRTIKNGETVKAVFIFERIPEDLARAMKLDLGVEFITNEGYGIDLKIGKVKFQDLPVSTTKTLGLNVEVSKKLEAATSAASFDVKKIEVADKTPPTLDVTSPSNVVLAGKEASRGRPYAQSFMGMDDKRKRALTTGEEFATSENSILVKGKATDENGIYTVVINGIEANLNNDGSFDANVPLAVGKNEIAIRATDIRQNSIEKKFFVLRKGAQGVKGEAEELDLVFNAEKKVTKYYALILGANDYIDESVSDLDQPISDAAKLALALTSRYTFNQEDVTFIKNPTREQIINEFDRLTRKLTKNDNLLIFYAGHGHWDQQTDFGYWLPVDSKSNTTSNWLANSQIKDYVAALKTKHTLLITDACFGGSIFRTRKTFEETSVAKNKLYDNPSRQAMTSGALTVVPDKSLFLEYLVKRLNENTKDYLAAEELFSSFKTDVMNGSPVTPMFGDIKDSGDEGGDFIFVKK
ncbi:MAG: hypothetical protein EHM93_14525 [Bacteroidales bacterium]|nr:MAG: hypothetical protein EHM93_14525 [Bacteroidales bacterium]